MYQMDVNLLVYMFILLPLAQYTFLGGILPSAEKKYIFSGHPLSNLV